MNPEIKQKWLDALRSGEYEQAKGALRKQDDEGNDLFCCLGVLCDIVAKGDWVEAQEYDDQPVEFGFNVEYHDYHTGDPRTYFESGVLPKQILNIVGLEDANPLVKTDDPEEIAIGVNLASLNDRGMSFAELADLIEAQL